MSTFDPILADLVERQLRNWELARAQRLAVPEEARPEVEDFVCISRMVGVDAGPVAAALGERLGWPVFDKELLEVMAGDDRSRRIIYAEMDERDLTWWEAVIRPLIEGQFRRDDYFHRLCDTVLALARQAPAVFVGRGADRILPAGRGLRVRLTASLEARLAAVAVRLGGDRERARAEIARIEEERRHFFLHRFDIAPDDPARHDLSLNLDRWTPGEAVALILAARARSA